MNQVHSNEGDVFRCIIPECNWTYPCSFGPQESLELIKLHLGYSHSKPNSQSAATSVKAPELKAPSIDVGVDDKAWTTFALRWQQYWQFQCRIFNAIVDLQSLLLFQCASKSLRSLFLEANPNIRITDCSPEVVLEKLRQLAVVPPTSKIIARADLMQMTQDNDELFRTFFLRVQGRAEICRFSTKHKCQCGVESAVNYTNDVIKAVIVTGIRDESMRTSVLDTEDIDEKNLEDIIFLVERKEMDHVNAEHNLPQDSGNSENISQDSTTTTSPPPTTPITNGK